MTIIISSRWKPELRCAFLSLLAITNPAYLRAVQSLVPRLRGTSNTLSLSARRVRNPDRPAQIISPTLWCRSSDRWVFRADIGLSFLTRQRPSPAFPGRGSLQLSAFHLKGVAVGIQLNEIDGVAHFPKVGSQTAFLLPLDGETRHWHRHGRQTSRMAALANQFPSVNPQLGLEPCPWRIRLTFIINASTSQPIIALSPDAARR